MGDCAVTVRSSLATLLNAETDTVVGVKLPARHVIFLAQRFGLSVPRRVVFPSAVPFIRIAGNERVEAGPQ